MKIILIAVATFLFSTKGFSQCSANFSMSVNGSTVNFISQSSTSQGFIALYYWNFGDGSTGFIANPVHVYPAPGAYMVQHVVQNNLGTCADTVTMMVLISPAPAPNHVLLCPPSASTTLNAGNGFSTYQWQLSTDSVNYSNLLPGPNYSGVLTNQLNLINIPSSFTGFRYRCLTDGNPGTPYRLSFQNSWTGTQDNTWSNTANWSCGTLPDANTDVIVTTGSVLVNVNATIRSLTIQSPATVTVQPGITLTVLH